MHLNSDVFYYYLLKLSSLVCHDDLHATPLSVHETSCFWADYTDTYYKKKSLKVLLSKTTRHTALIFGTSAQIEK